jgi:hypothetical protein
VGLILFSIGAARAGTDTASMLRSAFWIGPGSWAWSSSV